MVVAPLAVPALEAATVTEIESIAGSALFLAAARRRNSRFTVDTTSAPAIAKICARLDGLPLALELAAARTAVLSVEELAVGLVDAGMTSASARATPPTDSGRWTRRSSGAIACSMRSCSERSLSSRCSLAERRSKPPGPLPASSSDSRGASGKEPDQPSRAARRHYPPCDARDDQAVRARSADCRSRAARRPPSPLRSLPPARRASRAAPFDTR